MSATRDEIINYLQKHGSSGVADLATATGVTPVSIRHHLSALQAEGQITSVESHSGVGRPKLLYSLTEAASERFPGKYVHLTDMAAGHKHKFEGKTLEEKVELLISVLGEEGFMAAWNKVGDAYHLTEYNCPYFAIGQRHPEVCTIDQTLISNMLDSTVEKTTCILNGDQRCVFVIYPKPIKPAEIEVLA
jgi:DeoR family suf operon transcriptional repressor